MPLPAWTRPAAAVRRLPVATASYAALLAAAAAWYSLQSLHRRSLVLAHSSTDIWHLEHDPWVVLPASAVWAVSHPAYWVAAAACCLGVLEHRRGVRVTLAVAAMAHVLGTLVSEGVVWVRVALGDLPASARHVLDVGPSYVVTSCSVAVICDRTASRRARLACLAAIVPIVVVTVAGVPSGDVAAVGHLVAAAVGVVAGRRLGRGGMLPGGKAGGGSVAA